MDVEAVQEQVVGASAAAPTAIPSGGMASGSHRDTEVTVVGQQQWQEIRQQQAAGQNVSAITRELRLDRKTVRI
jgi:hypothetical protein